MREKKIVITEDAFMVDGMDAIEALSFLVGTACKFFNDRFGKINIEKTGKCICDVFFAARQEGSEDE